MYRPNRYTHGGVPNGWRMVLLISDILGYIDPGLTNVYLKVELGKPLECRTGS